jgi:hypothetical protein
MFFLLSKIDGGGNSEIFAVLTTRNKRAIYGDSSIRLLSFVNGCATIKTSKNMYKLLI